MSKPEPPPEPDEGERSDFSKIAVIVFVAALALGGVWLFKTLSDHSRIGDCIASGRHDCVPLDPSAVGR